MSVAKTRTPTYPSLTARKASRILVRMYSMAPRVVVVAALVRARGLTARSRSRSGCTLPSARSEMGTSASAARKDRQRFRRRPSSFVCAVALAPQYLPLHHASGPRCSGCASCSKALAVTAGPTSKLRKGQLIRATRHTGATHWLELIDSRSMGRAEAGMEPSRAPTLRDGVLAP